MCRLGSVDGDGAPHVSPLWFVWDGAALWLHSIVKSQRWVNLMRDPRVSVAVDGGTGYFELRGVELLGRVEVVGDVPRAEQPNPATAAAGAAVGRQVHGRQVPPRRQARLVAARARQDRQLGLPEARRSDRERLPLPHVIGGGGRHARGAARSPVRGGRNAQSA